MPSTINHNWREEVLKYRYPFSPESTLRADTLFFGTDFLVDACLYIKRPVELPLRIHSVDGTRGSSQARVNICDNTSEVCAYFDITEGVPEPQVYMPEGPVCGAVVLNPDGVRRILNAAYGTVHLLRETTAVFLLETTVVTRCAYLRYIRVNGTTLTGDVRIQAGNGCRIVEEDGTFRVDVLGQLPQESGRLPVRSINGVAARDIWLQNHPRANVRIYASGENLHIDAVRDDT